MSRRWWDKTTSPVPGCTPTSPGCRHCWAKATAENRLRGRYGYDEDEPFKVKLRPERLAEPLKVLKPTQWFYNSMGDLFHEKVPDEFIAACFGVMAACPQHTFQVLTKRAERLLRWFEWAMTDDNLAEVLAFDFHRLNLDTAAERLGGSFERGQYDEYGRCELAPYWDDIKFPWPLPNVWLGVTAEDQQRADERIPLLLQTPAAVRFVSVEPMLGPVNFAHLWLNDWSEYPPQLQPADWLGPLGWAICGAETGPGARPMDIDGARSLLAQCKAAGAPFFFKGAGPGVPIPEDLDIMELPEVRDA
jgi:protein gp37